MRRITRLAPALVALSMVAGLYGFTRLPDIDRDEAAALSSSFRFKESILPILDGPLDRRIRGVHPSLERVSAWISATGAAVALGDFDRDGLANDYCLVDPRENEIFVGPVPKTGDRFPMFALNADPLEFSHDLMAPMGCLPGDFNEDGLRDLLVYYWGRSPILYLARASGVEAEARLSRASFVAQELVPGVPVWNSNGGTVADLDGDGHLDIVITNYFGDGDAVLDVNGTGKVDMQTSMSTGLNGGSTRLFLWQAAAGGDSPKAIFKDVSDALDESISNRWTLAVAATDLDGDLLPELFMANDFAADVLLHNRSTPGVLKFVPLEGRRMMTSPRSKVLGRDSFKGMGVDYGDLNNDGHLDIFVSNIAQEFALEESHHMFISTGDLGEMSRGIAPFQDRSEELGLARSAFSWEARLADFNNDGWVEALQATGFVKGDVDRWPELHELAIGNDGNVPHAHRWPRFQLGDDLSGHVHNPFFVRSESGRYYDLAAELGIAKPVVSRGIATADVDGDGDLDLAVANQWDDSQFFLNDTNQAGSFLGLRLVISPDPNLSGAQIFLGEAVPAGTWPAVGATAKLKRSADWTQVGYIDGGNGHSGVRSPEIHFGLGDFAQPNLEVVLQWRNPTTEGPQEATVTVRPGWNTIILGGDGKFESDSDTTEATR